MRAVVVVALAVAAGAGCAQLVSPGKSCQSAGDCPVPLVCCTDPLITGLDEIGGPLCTSRAECRNGYMPFLQRGSPCGRASDAGAGDSCRAGLVCCPQTLTCEIGAECATFPAPQSLSMEPAATECSADSDCPADTICCELTYQNRKGTCRSYQACGMAAGIAVPMTPVDAGPPPPDSGTAADLAAAICDNAYCGKDGARAPTPVERTACINAFNNGLQNLRFSYAPPSQACLDAMMSSRPYCAFALRPRRGVDLENDPVLPAACRLPMAAPEPNSRRACAKLEACGKLGMTTRASCEANLAGLGYDVLSHIFLEPDCTFNENQLGWELPGAGARCENNTDCPSDQPCVPTAAKYGLCVKAGCNPGNGCNRGERCYRGFCRKSCDLTTGDRDLIDASCGGRVQLTGGPEMACGPTALCAPFTDPATCPNGLGPLLIDGRYNYNDGYACSATARTGMIARQQPCTMTGATNPCADGVCIANLGGFCSDPCILGATPSTCKMGEICALAEHPGQLGACLTACVNGTCAGGLRCTNGYCDPRP